MAPPFCKQYQTPFYDNDSIITFETIGTADVCSLPIFRDVHQIFGTCWTWCQKNRMNYLWFGTTWTIWVRFAPWRGKGTSDGTKTDEFSEKFKWEIWTSIQGFKRAFQKNCDMIFRKWGRWSKAIWIFSEKIRFRTFTFFTCQLRLSFFKVLMRNNNFWLFLITLKL